MGAEARSSLNVRSGPGPEHRVVDVLQPGEQVRVLECSATGNWCAISHHGPDGWVYARYLDGVRPLDETFVEITNTDATVTFEVTVSVDDGLTFTMLDAYEAEETILLRRNAVCFYEHANYTGHSFCVSEGAGEARLGSFWDDRISSIRVLPGMAVKVCDTEGMRGRCGDVTRSYSSLGADNDGVISSYQVY
jgi:hypothetical protein